jgi:hypothetical protein
MKIRIDVPCYNRKEITELCLKQMFETKGSNGFIRTYNDHSEDYDNDFLEPYSDAGVIRLLQKTNIHSIRSHGFRSFLENDEYDFLYMTDNDAFVDPNWLNRLLEMYKLTGLPCSIFHSKYVPQSIAYAKDADILIKPGFTGISEFFHRTHVEKIVNYLNIHGDFQDMWDCVIWGILGHRFAVSGTSYTEHLGVDGMHHKTWDSEKSLNPTLYLKEKWDEIVPQLDAILKNK